MFFGLFDKKDDDHDAEPANYSRRQFLRGGFVRDALDKGREDTLDEDRVDDSPDQTREDVDTSGAIDDNQAAHFDLLAMLAAADPSASDRQLPPGYGRLENHRRRGGARSPRQRKRGQIPILRPPGAVAEEDFLQMCTRCNDCVDACPYDSITLAPKRFKAAADTPMIDAFDSPCRMCEDTPCVDACGTGALDASLPLKMGIAHLQTYNCLAYNQSICNVCEERCPVDGAIALDDGRPRIVDEHCTGCGVCHSVCPAPINAIMIMPVPNRPPAPRDGTVQPSTQSAQTR